MADPRDTARTWLAERYEVAVATCDERAHTMTNFPCAACLADAILTAPGVETEEDRIRRFPKEVGDEEALEVRNPRHMRVTHTQVVIRLPAQLVGDGDG